eukprot:TRINITY_DN6333_c0_g1_i2.p1 TRINITY_DN6333_c0_g1~~TRINITY_DN6333_c0_g1_i2.p1  ORF type:complete len:1079 (+),score=197.71 TRINITY_DN6333_c0_g1_i2:240-3476(+)
MIISNENESVKENETKWRKQLRNKIKECSKDKEEENKWIKELIERTTTTIINEDDKNENQKEKKRIGIMEWKCIGIADLKEEKKSFYSKEGILLIGLLQIEFGNGTFCLSSSFDEEHSQYISIQIQNVPSINQFQFHSNSKPKLMIATKFNYCKGSSSYPSKLNCNQLFIDNQINLRESYSHLPHYLEIMEFMLLDPLDSTLQQSNVNEELEYWDINHYSLQMEEIQKRKRKIRGEESWNSNDFEDHSEKEEEGSDLQQVHLRGIITAISPMISFKAREYRRNKESGKLSSLSTSKPTNFFFVELSSREQGMAMSSTLVFHNGDCSKGLKDSGMKWRSFLRIGMKLSVSHLKPTLSKGRGILTLTRRTRINQLEYSILNKQMSSHVASVCSEEDKDYQIMNYVGIITSFLIDSIVQLDGKINLYLTHYLVNNEGRSLRIGTKIKLFNIHPIYVHQKFQGLGCCTYSHICIDEFSDDLSSSYPPLFQLTSPLRYLWRRLNVYSLSWFFKTYYTLSHLFMKLVGENEINQLFFKRDDKEDESIGIIRSITKLLGSNPENYQNKRDIKDEFLRHEGCSLCTNNGIELPEVVPISSWSELAFPLDGSGGSLKTVDSSHLENFLFLGFLNQSSSGDIQLSDSTGSIGIVITDFSFQFNLGSLLRLESFTFVQENWQGNNRLYIIVHNKNGITCLWEPLKISRNNLKDLIISHSGETHQIKTKGTYFDAIFILIHSKTISNQNKSFSIRGRIIAGISGNQHENMNSIYTGDVEESIKLFPLLQPGIIYMIYLSNSMDSHICCDKNGTFSVALVEAYPLEFQHQSLGRIRSFAFPLSHLGPKSSEPHPFSVEDFIQDMVIELESLDQIRQLVEDMSEIELSIETVSQALEKDNNKDRAVRGIISSKTLRIENGRQKVNLKIRDQLGNEDLWLYLSFQDDELKLGLIEGMLVTFFGLQKQRSAKENIYFTCRAVDYAFESYPHRILTPQELEKTIKEYTPVILSQFNNPSKEFYTQILRVCGRIVGVKEIQFFTRKNGTLCYNMFVKITDGSGEFSIALIKEINYIQLVLPFFSEWVISKRVLICY